MNIISQKLRSDRNKYQKKNLWVLLRVIDFIIRKRYRLAIFLFWIIGLLIVFAGRKIFGQFDNIELKDNIYIAIYYTTAIIVLCYTRETYDIKRIQNKQIEELRKSRYLQKMPMIRIVSMGKEQKPEVPENYKNLHRFVVVRNPYLPEGVELQDTGKVIAFEEEEKYYYKFVYKNIGDDWAFIEKVIVWIGNPNLEKEIVLEQPSFKRNLFRNEEDIVSIYKTEKSKDDPEKKLYPQKIKIFYSDRYKNKFIYTAKRSLRISKPTPFLGADDYFEEEIEYPSILK